MNQDIHTSPRCLEVQHQMTMAEVWKAGSWKNINKKENSKQKNLNNFVLNNYIIPVETKPNKEYMP